MADQWGGRARGDHHSLTLNNIPYALDGTIVSVIASNVVGAVTNSATLTVIVPPVITPVPTNLVVNVGDTAILYSGATGVPTPALQWYKNGTLLAASNQRQPHDRQCAGLGYRRLLPGGYQCRRHGHQPHRQPHGALHDAGRNHPLARQRRNRCVL